jgi:hypothetical protein
VDLPLSSEAGPSTSRAGAFSRDIFPSGSGSSRHASSYSSSRSSVSSIR